ncbi:3'-5' exonuclease domain-containing protein [Entamoeba marina]
MSFSQCKIHYCRNEKEWESKNKSLLKADYVGFDCESSGGGVQVIQLSTMTEAFVLHVIHFNGLPQSLINILTNPDVTKIGVGVHKDFLEIEKKYSIVCKGAHDVGFTGYVIGISNKYFGIAVLGQLLLNEKKLESFGNWNLNILSPEQIKYAGKDAWLGIAIAEKIYNESMCKKEKRRMSMSQWMHHYENDADDIRAYGYDLINSEREKSVKQDVLGELKGIKRAKNYVRNLQKLEKETLEKLEKSTSEKKPKPAKGETSKSKKQSKKQISASDDILTNIIFD